MSAPRYKEYRVAATTVADRMKARMVTLGMSQAQLSRATGMSTANVSNILNGVVSNPIHYAFELADALKCDARWLMTGKGEACPHCPRCGGVL